MQIRWLSVALLMAASVSGAADGRIEFAGVMGAGADTRVLLVTKEHSGWVSVGKRYLGYSVVRYDAKTDVLTLQKDGEELRLKLKESRVKDGAVELSPEARNSILNNLRQLASAADQYYLEHGKPRTTFDDLVGPEPRKYIKTIMPVDGENYRAIQFEQGKPLEVRTLSGHAIKYDH